MDGGGRVPPIGPDIPGGELPPLGPQVSLAGDFPSLDFKAGATTAIENVIVLPKDFEGKDLLIEVPFSVDVAAVLGDTMELILGFQAVKCDAGESLSPAPTFLTVTALGPDPEFEFPGNFPDPGELACARFIIPASAVEESDSVRLTFWRSRTDVYEGKFQMIGYRY